MENLGLIIRLHQSYLGDLLSKQKLSHSFLLKKKSIAKRKFLETSISVWHLVQAFNKGPQESSAQRGRSHAWGIFWKLRCLASFRKVRISLRAQRELLLYAASGGTYTCIEMETAFSAVPDENVGFGEVDNALDPVHEANLIHRTAST